MGIDNKEADENKDRARFQKEGCTLTASIAIGLVSYITVVMFYGQALQKEADKNAKAQSQDSLQKIISKKSVLDTVAKYPGSTADSILKQELRRNSKNSAIER